jgi:hypothetical protein
MPPAPDPPLLKPLNSKVPPPQLSRDRGFYIIGLTAGWTKNMKEKSTAAKVESAKNTMESHKTNSSPFPVKVFAACFVVVCVAAVLFAQESGINAGGKWMEYDSQDQMTLAKKTRFELDADNSLPGSQGNPQIILYCTNGKLNLADFRPNARIAPPNRPGFWGQPQMEVLVRVDNSHSKHGWNWVNGHFLSMDKGTTRELLGAQVFKVEIQTPRGPEIASFSPGGLDLSRVKKACGLTPKKPD